MRFQHTVHADEKYSEADEPDRYTPILRWMHGHVRYILDTTPKEPVQGVCPQNSQL